MEKSNEELVEYIRNCFIRYLEREPSSNDIAHYAHQIKNGVLQVKQLDAIFENSEERRMILKTKNELKNWNNEIDLILKKRMKKAEKITKEIENIFVSCFNESNGEGGVYQLKNMKLEPVFLEYACYGMFFDNKRNLLFCGSRNSEQIIVFKIENKEIKKMNVSYDKYIFAEDIHGVIVSENKIFTIATNGEKDGTKAENAEKNNKDKVSKIISSELEITGNQIIIKNSKVINPFNCNHHHHINDIVIYNEKYIFSSHSYCKNKQLISKGGVFQSNLESAPELLYEIEQPHSLLVSDDRIYLCASNFGSIVSINLETTEKYLEYKGLDAYARGLLITNSFYYIGYSSSFSRTNSNFNNSKSGVLIFNKNTGESTKVPIPENCDNIYSIIGF